MFVYTKEEAIMASGDKSTEILGFAPKISYRFKQLIKADCLLQTEKGDWTEKEFLEGLCKKVLGGNVGLFIGIPIDEDSFYYFTVEFKLGICTILEEEGE